MRPAALLAGLMLLCACHQRRQANSVSPEDLRRVRHHARKAFAQAQPSRGAPAPQPAPESNPLVKVLGRDKAGCTWVQSDGLVTVGDQDSRYQARAAAISEARKSAMQNFLGVDVQTRFLDFQDSGLRGQDQLVENILRTTRLGRILKEDVVSEGYQDAGDCKDCRYHVALKTCLAKPPPGQDQDFRAELSLSRTHFTDGDDAQITVSATEDCYVYLYNVDMDWTTSLIVPNEAVPEVRLKAGQVFTYPDEQLRKSGIRLVAEVPQGQSVSAETIRLIATKTPLRQDEQDPAMGGYLSLLRRLNASDVDWTDDAQAFVIYRR